LSKEAVCNGLVSHPAIFINETLARLNPHYHPSQSSPELVPVSAALSHTVQNLCAIQPPDAPDTNQAF